MRTPTSWSAPDNALRHVQKRAEAACVAARATIAELLERHELAPSVGDSLVRALRERARVTVNFHPDRPLTDGSTVAERLFVEGCYRSQLVTGISNGSRTTIAGGDRELWEKRLFGNAYDIAATNPDARPKYGGLNVMDHADGACPRFGSCYLELRPEVATRCTFTWGDSHADPQHVGTFGAFEPIVAALLESVDETGEALGLWGFDVSTLAAHLAPPAPSVASEAAPNVLQNARREPAARRLGRALDAYIEAQVHGDIDLARDVEALVADPAFQGTATGDQLSELAAKHGFTLAWHPGFVLATSDVPANFRGPRMVPLASYVDERFARVPGELDAFVIGRAAQALQNAPEIWTEKHFGSVEQALQNLKQLWHVAVRYGRARSERTR